MDIVRKYYDEKEWEPVSEEEVAKVFLRYYNGTCELKDMALQNIADGLTVYTSGGKYRLAEHPNAKKQSPVLSIS